MNIVNERPKIGSIGSYKECGDQVPTKDWTMLPKGDKTKDIVQPPTDGSPKDPKQSDVSPTLLRKKIAKTHSLMKEQAENKEKKGRDSKLYKKLALKLEQYEAALFSLESEPTVESSVKLPTADEILGAPASPNKATPLVKTGKDSKVDITPQKKAKKRSSKEKSPKGVTASNVMEATTSPDGSQPSKIDVILQRTSDISGVVEDGASPTAKYDKPVVLKRKIKKVKKMIADLVREHGKEAKTKKEHKKLTKKLSEYESTLKEFESRMIFQALDGTRILPTVPVLGVTSSKVTADKKSKDDKKKKTKDSKKTTSKKKPATKVSSVPTDKEGSKKATKVPTKDKTSKKSGRTKRGGPRRKSTRVSAPRLQELTSEFKPSVFPKDKDAEDLIRTEIKRNFVFGKLADSSVEELVQAFEPIDDYENGEAILEQGEYSEPVYFYIIGSGSVDYEVNQEVVGNAGPGTSFGEQGLLYSWPRKATVRARETTSLFRIDQVTFRYTMQNQTKFNTVWRQSVTKVMAMNRMLGLSALKKLMEEDESDEEDSLGIASAGRRSVDDGLEGGFQMGELQDDGEKEVDDMIGRLSQKRRSVQNSFCESRVSMESFSRESMLGEGQFGEVWLVTPNLEELESRDFALKTQSKEDVFRESNMSNNTTVAEAIERECNVLSQLCHPFVVEFVHKFEDDENIYLVMGVIKGMELWNVIHRELDDGEWESGIPESNSKFYGLLVADTVNYMHKKSICYRDLKPENVMIDHNGYPVIVDFGFAKQIPDGQTFTFCGTPNYTCPEIVGNQGHGFAADWWALGVVIYEMVSGENPFYYDGMSEMQLLEEITTGTPEPLGDEYSLEVKDLISKLLVKDPEERLGSSKLGGKEILNHAWFSDLELLEARKMQLAPPFIPPTNNS